MKKAVVMMVVAVGSLCANAAYQVYDVKVSLNTTKDVSVSLPYPLNMYYYGNTIFRAKAKDNLTGMVVCWNANGMRRPAFMYLRSSLTGKTYVSGQNLWTYWSVFNRLSPKDAAVECCWTIELDGDYSIQCAGVGKPKAVKFKRWWGSGWYSEAIGDSYKGNVTGERYVDSRGCTLDGTAVAEDECESCYVGGSRPSAAYGTWTLKRNKRYSDAIYKLATAPGGRTCVSCCDDGDAESAGTYSGPDEGVELSTEEIAGALGF